jgi:hypothetical protein
MAQLVAPGLRRVRAGARKTGLETRAAAGPPSGPAARTVASASAGGNWATAALSARAAASAPVARATPRRRSRRPSRSLARASRPDKVPSLQPSTAAAALRDFPWSKQSTRGARPGLKESLVAFAQGRGWQAVRRRCGFYASVGEVGAVIQQQVLVEVEQCLRLFLQVIFNHLLRRDAGSAVSRQRHHSWVF